MSRIFQGLNKIRAIAAALRFRSVGTKNPLLPGGGLEKLQGGFREEAYFKSQDEELMQKIREQEMKLKYEDNTESHHQLTKSLDASANQNALRDSCCKNKQKNCCEEAYFLGANNESLQLMKKTLKDQRVLSSGLEQQKLNPNQDDSQKSVDENKFN